jgi:ankyrin repeat protein
MLMPKKKRMELDDALILAARNGENEELRRLIKAGADVTPKDAVGRTALHFAVEWKNIETCKLIIEKCAKSNKDRREFITAKSESGGTALHDAAFNGSTEICALLIKEYAKANGDVKTLITVKRGDLTPLQWAVCNGPSTTEACKLLIEEYAKAGGDPKALINSKDKDERTPLHAAARIGCTENCGLLIQKYTEAGGSLNELTARDKDGKTPIHLAMEGGYVKTARFLAVELIKATMGKTFSAFMKSFSECIAA